MQNLEIKQTPAKIDFNYEVMKASIEKELARFDITVTEDTVADAKKLATELNAMKNDIDKRRKEAVKAVSAPIKAADDQMKELVKLMESGRQKLIKQTAEFDAKLLEDLADKLNQAMADLRQSSGIRDEFRTSTCGDLVIISNRTTTGNVSGKAMSAIKERVAAEKAMQDQTDRRLLELENHCYRSGLDAPLQRQHVEHFLFADDEVYGQNLERMMQAELNRQEHASARREQMSKKPDPEPAKEVKAPAEEKPAPVQRDIPEGKRGATVVATFEITVKPEDSKEKIESNLRAVMKKAGITTLASVEINFDDEQGEG